ncbi:hypothetical protein M2324_003932 [Rhodovulum sulfidophilum]|uniref:hypothetical protein n=1 Tax=Rhodovulum sulfidophilum TaxID=35806 RepID=UPI0018C8640A|nr:hypothetical protein [Rhodovulum sulfidophilum]MCW2305506.1 hypothetical protein [Rhodovulum sulfidophilum]
MSFKNCDHCNDCDDLLNELQRRAYSTESGGNKGLLTRWAEQVFGCQTPQNTISAHASCAGHRMSGTWEGHNQAMRTQQQRLRDAVEEYDDNDCGDKVSDPTAARRSMRDMRRMAYSGSVPVAPGDYKGPPVPGNVSMPRTMGQAVGDFGRGICLSASQAGGTLIGGGAGAIGGGVAGGVVDGAIGAGAGTLVAPGLGTVGGAATGAGYGAATGAVAGGLAGGSMGYNVGTTFGNWLCY